VISAATYHLVQGYFVCESLGDHHLPGPTEPSVLYQVLDASAARGRLDLTLPQQLTPLVGREAELAVLWERVAQVRQGLGQVVLLRGEAGMGKSRLVQVVKTALTADGYTAMEFQGSPYSQHTALHPVIEWLQGCVQGDADTPVPERMARLEDLVQQARLDLSESLPLLAALLRLDLPEERYPALQLTPQRQRQRTLETLLALVLAHAERQPLLCIVEDLHWIDPTTLAWLGLSWVLWLLGYPDQAHRRSQETLALAQALAHPHSLATALSFAAMFHQFRREVAATEALAEATVTLATEQGMAQRLARGTFLRGWALTAQGRGEDGLAQMRQGLANSRATGTVLDLPWCLGVLAEACGSTSRVDEGLGTIAEALTVADNTGYYEAELVLLTRFGNY
jgi:hypothetical protein